MWHAVLSTKVGGLETANSYLRTFSLRNRVVFKSDLLSVLLSIIN